MMNSRRRLRGISEAAARGAGPTGARRDWSWLGPWAIGALVAFGFADSLAAAVVAGVVAAVISEAARRRWPRERLKIARQAARQATEVPFALDVVAATLRAGLPVPAAFESAAEVCDRPLRHRLSCFSRALRLGVAPVQAGAWLEHLVCGERIVAAVARSIHSGAMLANSVELLALELREEQEWAAQAAAQRTGVWMVLPLCLCFLPAFVVAGLVPVVMSTLGDVMRAN